MTRRLPVHNLDPADGADGDGILIAGGVFTIGPLPSGGGGGDATTCLVPLTTVVAGEPVLVWEADNSLALTEVPR